MTQGFKKKMTEAQEFSFDYPGLGPNMILVDSVVPLAWNSAVSPRFPDNPPSPPLPGDCALLTLRQGDDPAAGESVAGGGGCGQRTCVFKVRMCISCHGQLLRWPKRQTGIQQTRPVLALGLTHTKDEQSGLGPPAVLSGLFSGCCPFSV